MLARAHTHTHARCAQPPVTSHGVVASLLSLCVRARMYNPAVGAWLHPQTLRLEFGVPARRHTVAIYLTHLRPPPCPSRRRPHIPRTHALAHACVGRAASPTPHMRCVQAAHALLGSHELRPGTHEPWVRGVRRERVGSEPGLPGCTRRSPIVFKLDLDLATDRTTVNTEV